MKTFKARALVIKETEAGESDKRLTLFCKDYGKLYIYARGAKKPKSKFMAAAQLFNWGDFILSDGGNFYALAQAEPIETFYSLREDYMRLCYAHYIAEICDKTLPDGTPANELLHLALTTIQKISLTAPRQGAIVFLYRFFMINGIMPKTDECSVCGAIANSAAGGLCFCDEGFLCGSCVGKKAYRAPLGEGSYAAIKYIVSVSIKDAFLFRIGDKALLELEQAARLYFNSHFRIKLKTLEFLT